MSEGYSSWYYINRALRLLVINVVMRRRILLQLEVCTYLRATKSKKVCKSNHGLNRQAKSQSMSAIYSNLIVSSVRSTRMWGQIRDRDCVCKLII